MLFVRLVGCVESRTVQLKETLLVAVGVPATSPVDAFRVRPGGKARSTNHENGNVPPDA